MTREDCSETPRQKMRFFVQCALVTFVMVALVAVGAIGAFLDVGRTDMIGGALGAIFVGWLAGNAVIVTASLLADWLHRILRVS